MPASVWLGATLVIGGAMLFWWVFSTTREPQSARGRLAAPSNDLREVVLARPASERVVAPTMEKLAGLARVVTPSSMEARIEQKVDMAGVIDSWPVDRVMASKLILGGLLGTVGFINWATDPSDVFALLLAAVFAATGFVIPDMILNSRARSRMDQIRRELPDVLDQITISVEAGLGFEAALAMVSQHTDGPVGEEFRRTLHDIRLGRTREDAFNAMVARVDVEELRHFVIALQQAERLGVPIAQIMRTQAEEMRVIRKQTAEENAQKLPVKMIFPLIFCILPALMAVVLAPAIFDLVDKFPRF